MEVTIRNRSIGLGMFLVLPLIDCLEEARYTRKALVTTNKVVEAMSIAWTNPDGSAISFMMFARPLTNNVHPYCTTVLTKLEVRDLSVTPCMWHY